MFLKGVLGLVHGFTSTSPRRDVVITLLSLIAVAFILFCLDLSVASWKIKGIANLVVFSFVYAQTAALRRLAVKAQAIKQELSWARAECARRRDRDQACLANPEGLALFNSIQSDVDSNEADGVTAIVAVRNRESARLRNLLRSLRAQSYSREKLHIIVVDYDSEPAYHTLYQRLCDEFRAEMCRVDYRAVWCKSEALNLGMSRVKTRYTAITDVDIIYPSNYFTIATAALDEDPRRIIHSTVLETGLDVINDETDVVRDFANIRANATPRGADGRRSTYMYGQGIICLRASFIRAIGGFDEFYYGWGSEDDDLLKRLTMIGLRLHSIAKQADYLHHSHPKLLGLSAIEQERAPENAAYRARTNSVKRNIGASAPQLTETTSSSGSRIFSLQQQPRSISVIIPVFDHVDRLRTCLRALDCQTLPRERFEVIVVDNGHSEDVKRVTDEFPWCLYARESRAGSYAARNTGLARARGDVVAFTDADCVPAEDWLEKGHRYFFGPQRVSYLVGRIALYSAHPEAESAAERYERLFSFNQARLLQHQGFGATANLFVRRDVLEEMGGFNPGLFSAGDKELGERITALGLRTSYAEDTTVGHPTSNGVQSLVKRQVRYLGGEFDLALFRGEKRARTALYLSMREIYILVWLPWHVVRSGRGESLLMLARIIGVGVAIRLARCKEALHLWMGGASRRT